METLGEQVEREGPEEKGRGQRPVISAHTVTLD